MASGSWIQIVILGTPVERRPKLGRRLGSLGLSEHQSCFKVALGPEYGNDEPPQIVLAADAWVVCHSENLHRVASLDHNGCLAFSQYVLDDRLVGWDW